MTYFQVDAGTITDAATLTEPDHLGPCEPGTGVNLEGIVWHETDSGTAALPPGGASAAMQTGTAAIVYYCTLKTVHRNSSQNCYDVSHFLPELARQECKQAT